MPLDLFDNVLLQDLSLKALKRALQAFAFVQMNFSQRKSPRLASSVSRLSGYQLPASSYPARMDIGKMLAELRAKRDQFAEAILVLERLAAGER